MTALRDLAAVRCICSLISSAGFKIDPKGGKRTFLPGTPRPQRLALPGTKWLFESLRSILQRASMFDRTQGSNLRDPPEAERIIWTELLPAPYMTQIGSRASAKSALLLNLGPFIIFHSLRHIYSWLHHSRQFRCCCQLQGFCIEV